MEKIRIYKDPKEIPFLIYKRIKQTGDFLYMIKGYEEGDELEADPKDLESKFNSIIDNLSLLSDGFSQEMQDYANYVISTMEFNKFTTIANALDIIISTSEMLSEHGFDPEEENKKLVDDLLQGIIIERNPDLYILRTKIHDKISLHESNVFKYKEELEKKGKNNDDTEFDIDEQLINICLILELPFPDESKLTLYQYSLLNKKAIEKVKQLEKLNQK